MQIIGEKINGTRHQVAEAIATRNMTYIQDLAIRQTEAGAHWLDVNAGTHPDREADDLMWLVDIIQSVVDTPLCLDSANPKALEAAIPTTKHVPMINSISGEPERLNNILPLVVAHKCPVIALAMGDKQVPKSSRERMAVIRDIVANTRALGIADGQVYVDPLAMTIATEIHSAQISLETIRAVRQEFPQVHVTIGLSNISYGLPARSYVNRAFLTLAIADGLDCAIIDPLDRDMLGTLLATELALGHDRHCLNFTRAYKAGLFGVKKH